MWTDNVPTETLGDFLRIVLVPQCLANSTAEIRSLLGQVNCEHRRRKAGNHNGTHGRPRTTSPTTRGLHNAIKGR